MVDVKFFQLYTDGKTNESIKTLPSISSLFGLDTKLIRKTAKTLGVQIP